MTQLLLTLTICLSQITWTIGSEVSPMGVTKVSSSSSTLSPIPLSSSTASSSNHRYNYLFSESTTTDDLTTEPLRYPLYGPTINEDEEQDEDKIFYDLGLQREISQALVLLQSVGIDGICHPTSDAYHPVLFRCNNGHHNSVIPHLARSTFFRSHFQRDELGSSGPSSSSGQQTQTRHLLDEQDGHFEMDDHFQSTDYYVINIVGAVICIIFVAIIATMFLGYLTLEPLDLRIKIRASVDPDERKYAKKLLPVVQQHHRLLVTLLLMNAIFYESLPLFLDNVMPSWAAILLSVTVLLIFGEIIPSAIITGPYQLQLASQLTPLLNFFIWALFPIAKPLTMLLDYLIPTGADSDSSTDTGEAYHRGELSALVRIQYEDRQKWRKEQGLANMKSCMTPHYLNTAKDQQQHHQQQKPPKRRSSQNWKDLKHEILHAVEAGVNERKHAPTTTLTTAAANTAPTLTTTTSELNQAIDGGSDVKVILPPPPLHHAEVKMVEGALTMKTKCVLDVYTPLRKLFSIPSNLELDQAAIASIYGEGYSRVPVYDPDGGKTAIEGILMTRQLILIDWDDERPVSTLPLLTFKDIPIVGPKMNLVDLLMVLQQGTVMALVCTQPIVAMSALKAGQPLPPRAGFMGVVTLEDVMEAILQGTMYENVVVGSVSAAAEDMPGARLTQWWEQMKEQDQEYDEVKDGGGGYDGKTDEETPLLTK